VIVESKSARSLLDNQERRLLLLTEWNVSLLPAQEVWRFFIDGIKQKRDGRNFTLANAFLELATRSTNSQDPIATLLTQDNIPPRIEEMAAGLDPLYLTMTAKQFLRQCTKGWQAFETREPGYLQAMIRAFLPSLKPGNETPVSISFIKKLHLEATSNVAIKDLERKGDTTRKGNFRTALASYGFGGNCSAKGIFEILKKTQKERDYFLIYAENSAGEKRAEPVRYQSDEELYQRAQQIYQEIQEGTLKYRLITLDKVTEPGVFETLIQNYIDNYNQAIKNAKSIRDKIKAIVILVQDLEQLHPFYDANCRTICMLLLNHLLLQNQLPPAMLEDPNHFDGFAVDELVEKVIKGMENTVAVSNGNSIFGVTTSELLALSSNEQRRYFENAVQSFQEMSALFSKFSALLNKIDRLLTSDPDDPLLMAFKERLLEDAKSNNDPSNAIMQFKADALKKYSNNPVYWTPLDSAVDPDQLLDKYKNIKTEELKATITRYVQEDPRENKQMGFSHDEKMISTLTKLATQSKMQYQKSISNYFNRGDMSLSCALKLQKLTVSDTVATNTSIPVAFLKAEISRYGDTKGIWKKLTNSTSKSISELSLLLTIAEQNNWKFIDQTQIDLCLLSRDRDNQKRVSFLKKGTMPNLFHRQTTNFSVSSLKEAEEKSLSQTERTLYNLKAYGRR
jgi:hypothetical protein